jgi:hypothetical protein
MEKKNSTVIHRVAIEKNLPLRLGEIGHQVSHEMESFGSPGQMMMNNSPLTLEDRVYRSKSTSAPFPTVGGFGPSKRHKSDDRKLVTDTSDPGLSEVLIHEKSDYGVLNEVINSLTPDELAYNFGNREDKYERNLVISEERYRKESEADMEDPSNSSNETNIVKTLSIREKREQRRLELEKSLLQEKAEKSKLEKSIISEPKPNSGFTSVQRQRSVAAFVARARSQRTGRSHEVTITVTPKEVFETVIVDSEMSEEEDINDYLFS